MSDDLVKRLRSPDFGAETSERNLMISAANHVEAQAARIAELETECTRLRAACDVYFRTISLSQMRHGRILVGLERRNARQRRALARLCQRRHDKNFRIAELEAALRDVLPYVDICNSWHREAQKNGYAALEGKKDESV